MIDQKTHTAEWLESLRKKFPENDPILLEKCLKALTLLESLKRAGLEFVFRGGTSLLLMFEKARRISIDIDIITMTKPDALEQVLQKIPADGVFQRVEPNVRNQKSLIPKAHYKFYYHSLVTMSESHILLDILFEENPYPKIISLPIRSDFIVTKETAVKVAVPSVDCLLGDKFTTIAPNTIGIPVGKDKILEIGKQIYDLDFLFDQIADIDSVRTTFQNIATQELRYRDHAMTIDDVIQDSFETCLTVAFQGTKNKALFDEVSSAIKRVRNYSLENKNYTMDDALKVSGKLAYLGRLFRLKSGIEKYSEQTPVHSWDIVHPEYTRINKIKKRTLEGFYYWYRALES